MTVVSPIDKTYKLLLFCVIELNKFLLWSIVTPIKYLKECNPLERIAVLSLTYMALRVLCHLKRYLHLTFLGSFIGPKVNFKKLGRWAVVTGATDGIGKAYAEELARRDFNVALISRSEQKLEDTAKFLRVTYNIRCKTIVVDFTEDSSIYQRIEGDLKDLDVGILVNNVGMNYKNPEMFLKLPARNILTKNMIACNVMSVTMMSQIVMPQMVERGKGVVINIASTAALFPSPLLSVYGASKAYIVKLSRSLRSEYSSSGIVVQCVCPMLVATKLSKIKQEKMFAPSPQRFVKSAINTVGYQDITSGYLSHEFLCDMISVVSTISESAVDAFAYRFLSSDSDKAQ